MKFRQIIYSTRAKVNAVPQLVPSTDAFLHALMSFGSEARFLFGRTDPKNIRHEKPCWVFDGFFRFVSPIVLLGVRSILIDVETF